jgi:hypothetical protein
MKIFLRTIVYCLALTGLNTAAHSQCSKLSLAGTGKIVWQARPFEVVVKTEEGLDLKDGRVEWTISSGKIVSGQGTPKATLEANISDRGSPNSEVSITAQVSGLPNGCKDSISDTVLVQQPPGYSPQYWPIAKYSEMRGGLDNFFITAMNNPGSEIIAVVHFDRNSTRPHKVTRLKSIYEFVKQRGYDPTRMSIYIASPETKDYADVHIIPKNGRPEGVGVDSSKLIRLEDLPSKLSTLFRN